LAGLAVGLAGWLGWLGWLVGKLVSINISVGAAGPVCTLDLLLEPQNSDVYQHRISVRWISEMSASK